MAISSQQAASRQRHPTLVAQTDEFDEYVYYPYYEKSVPGGGYEYVPELEEVVEYEEEQPVEYVIERAPQPQPLSPPPQQTTVVQRT